MQTSKNDIIQKVISGSATKEEGKEVANWFSTTVEGQLHVSELMDRDAYMMENDPRAGESLSPVQSDKLFKKIDAKIRENRVRKIGLRVAAVALPFLLIAWLTYFITNELGYLGETTYTEVYVPKGEDARIYFQDGTEVFLNADTRIRYPLRFGFRKNREVFLDGEAYFRVGKNPRQPFFVHAQHTKVEVVGTSFNVKAYSEDNTVQVVLDEGRTTFHVGDHRYPMLPGQLVEYDKTMDRTTLRNLTHSSRASLWKSKTLYFYDTPLKEVIKVLERRFDVPFHVQSPEALQYTYTLTTRQTSIAEVLQELHKIAPVQFKTTEAKTIIVTL